MISIASTRLSKWKSLRGCFCFTKISLFLILVGDLCFIQPIFKAALPQPSQKVPLPLHWDHPLDARRGLPRTRAPKPSLLRAVEVGLSVSGETNDLAMVLLWVHADSILTFFGCFLVAGHSLRCLWVFRGVDLMLLRGLCNAFGDLFPFSKYQNLLQRYPWCNARTPCHQPTGASKAQCLDILDSHLEVTALKECPNRQHPPWAYFHFSILQNPIGISNATNGVPASFPRLAKQLAA